MKIPKIFMIKTNFAIFFYHFDVWCHSDVTQKLIVLILVDMDGGDQGLCIGTK